MSEPKSFRPSDFSIRDLPWFLTAYVIISALCVLAGLIFEAIPDFWAGVLFGIGIGLLLAIALFRWVVIQDTKK